MTRSASLLLAALALAALAPATGLTAGAQHRGVPVPAAELQFAAGSRAGAIIVNQTDDQLRGASLVRARVMSGDTQAARPIGDIEDLLFDRDGRLVAALVRVGGFLGIGDKTVAIAWTALERTTSFGEPLTFVTALTRDQLEAAPAFVTTAERKATEQKREVMEKARQQSPAATAPAPAGK